MSLQGFNPSAATGGGTITTSVTPGGGPKIPFQSGLAASPNTTESTESQLVQQYRAMSPALRKSLAAQLKGAGYKVPVTDKYNTVVRDAMVSAYSDFNNELGYLSANDPYRFESETFTFEKFLADQSAGGTGGAGREPYYQRTVSNKGDARTLINQVYQDLLGRGASDEEFNKYYKKIIKRQKNMPTKTAYTEKGGGTMATTTGGPSIGDYLFQEVAGTDEAKARKVFSFYDAFKQALGVD